MLRVRWRIIVVFLQYQVGLKLLVELQVIQTEKMIILFGLMVNQLINLLLNNLSELNLSDNILMQFKYLDNQKQV